MSDEQDGGDVSEWDRMDKRPRHPRASLTSESLIPKDPGVYAIYRDAERIYVGKAGSLRARIWKNHLKVACP